MYEVTITTKFRYTCEKMLQVNFYPGFTKGNLVTDMVKMVGVRAAAERIPLLYG